EGFAGGGFHGDAQGVFFLVVAEAAPRGGVFREDDGPLIFVGDHVQAIGARGERLAFDGGVVGESDGGVFVGPGAPDFSIGHDFAPDFAAVGEGTAIFDSHGADADGLRGFAVLADAGKI